MTKDSPERRSMTQDPVADLCREALGSSCNAMRLDNEWLFSFGQDGGVRLVVQTNWRLIAREQVALTAEDDGQLFGLPTPIDAEVAANSLLQGRSVTDIQIDRRTGDVRVQFGGEPTLEIWTNSSGYESWTATFTVESEEVTLIGGGGGKLSVVRRPVGTSPRVVFARSIEK